MRGADLIAEYLISEKVPYVFGLCGHGIIGLMDGLVSRADRIKMIGVHHEQVAGYMADAYYRVAHRPVATFTSCGPGSVNLVIALACAMMDSSALVAITGNVPTSQFNRGPFQETYRHHQADFPSVARPYVKRSFQPTRPEMLPLALRQAFKTAATGRPGPVNVDVPFDVFVEETEAALPDPGAWWHGIDGRPGPSPALARRALDLLVAAERPVILVGNGAVLSEAAPEIRRLAEMLGAPVAHTPLGAGVMPADHPLALGVVGRNGTYPANQATSRADVLLALGARFDDRVSSGWIPGYTFTIPPTKLVQVDLDAEEIGRNYPVHLGVTADVKTFVSALLALAGSADARTGHERWREQVDAWRRDWDEYNTRHYRPEAVPVQPEHVVRTLRQVLARDAIVAVDVGIHHNWVVQQWPAYLPQTLLQSWGFAAMGFAVGGVLGAKLAAPDRSAVAVCGDGGFLMASHAVATAVEYGIPATWVVWNNHGYASIRDLQRGAFGKETTTMFNRVPSGEPFSPDYAMLARACGADGIRVTQPGELGDALAAAVRSDRPTLIDVVVDASRGPIATGTWQLPPLAHPEPNYPALAGRAPS
ncbi:MAG: thiamine pyrophosphate-binding protein, partial [Candidatus Rokubacteria bacterium]|nr:thiamine pyrophosphate-binding protein [Candidatus Rokubacteria bacterium]